MTSVSGAYAEPVPFGDQRLAQGLIAVDLPVKTIQMDLSSVDIGWSASRLKSMIAQTAERQRQIRVMDDPCESGPR